MFDIRQWLEKLGLDQYADAFDTADPNNAKSSRKQLGE